MADVGHEFVSSFEAAPAKGMLREPAAVAVDHATGNVFVGDETTGVVDVFDSSGKYLTRFGSGLEAVSVAVDEATGVVFVAEPLANVVLAFKPDGSGGYAQSAVWTGALAAAGSFGEGEVLGVAVDNSTSPSDPSAGDVYVVDTEGPALNKGETKFAAAEVFKPDSEGGEDEFVHNLAGKGLEEPNGVAVDSSTGRVYLADSEKGLIEAFSSSGVYESKLKGVDSPIGPLEEGDVTAIAVDETNGDVLVAQEESDIVSVLNSEGEWLGWITGTPTGPFGEVRGVAVGASGDVFVPDAERGTVNLFGPAATVPAASIRAPLRVTASEATVRGTVNGEGEQVTYHFEIGENEGYGGLSTPDTLTPTTGEETVQYAVGGLEPATKYYVRLVAETNGGINCSTGTSFTTAGGTGGGIPAISLSCARPPASIDSESATAISDTEATLQAQIDPHGHQSTAYFEYGTEPCTATRSSCVAAPQPAAQLGSGDGPVPLTAPLNELQPGTTYHYRAIATSSLGTTQGIEHTFTTPTAHPPALPDGRAWEMVTPPNKGGAAIEALTRNGGWIYAAESGNAFTYVTNGAIEEEVQGNRSFEPQQVLATREAAGWHSQDIATPNGVGSGANTSEPPEYEYFSPDLSLALVEPFVSEPALAPGVSGKMVFLRDDQPLAPGPDTKQSYLEAQANAGFLAPGFLPLVSPLNAPEAGEASARFLGATPNLDHIVVTSGNALAGPSSSAGLYEWSQGGGLDYLSVLPNGEPAPASSVTLGYYGVRAHAISQDGTRVIWTASQELPAHLYMHDTAVGTTLQLDAAQEGLAEPRGAARFQTASSAGDRVFFTDSQVLLNGASVEPARQIADLYECEVVEEAGAPNCSLRDLTIPIRKGERAAVQGQLLGASDDGTTLYLVAKGVLAANEGPAGDVALPGHDNLYRLHYDGSQWATTFIATLSAEDAPDWDAGPNVSDESTAFQTARVSPNGQFLAFMSQRSLTGYDNEDVSSEKPGERLDQEVYLYDGSDSSLTCASCSPSGARPAGIFDQEASGEGTGLVVDRRGSWRGQWVAGSIPGWTSESPTSALYQPRYLGDSGRLFFNSADPLVPGITAPTRTENVDGRPQTVGVENVYEYEPSGDDTCPPASEQGCVALISAGASQHESAFLEATPEGSDVFFLTAGRLTAEDTDGAFDIYDARECTVASPCLSPPAGAPAPCGDVEECHPAAPGTEVEVAASGSATFSGPGNPVPPMPKQEAKGVKTTSTRPLSRAQKLSRALRLCGKKHPHAKKKRRTCEAHARKLYGHHLVNKKRSHRK